MRIVQANNLTHIIQLGGYRALITVAAARLWGSGVRINWQTAGQPVKARIQRSYWCVPCPYCKNWIIAQRDEPFFCNECLMQNNMGHAVEVEWPDTETQKQIEAVLLKRLPENRNWNPDETVGDLERENAEHGIN